MSDLVERLRAWSKDRIFMAREANLASEAADEVERLRLALKQIATMQDGEQAWWARDIASAAITEGEDRA